MSTSTRTLQTPDNHLVYTVAEAGWRRAPRDLPRSPPSEPMAASDAHTEDIDGSADSFDRASDIEATCFAVAHIKAIAGLRDNSCRLATLCSIGRGSPFEPDIATEP
jgi:hypothetical protein